MNYNELDNMYLSDLVSELPPSQVAAMAEQALRDKLTKAVRRNPHEPGKAVNGVLARLGANGSITQRLYDEYGTFTTERHKVTSMFCVMECAKWELEKRERRNA